MDVQSMRGPAARLLQRSNSPSAGTSGDSRATRTPIETWTIALIYACVFQNFALALVNNFFFAVRDQTVIITQAFLTACACGLVYAGRARIEFPFLLGAMAFGACILLSSAFTGILDARFIYDVGLIPVFILLGMTARRFSISYLTPLLWIVAAVALFELMLPDVYVAILNPLRYFLSTRAWMGSTSGLTANIITANDLYFGSYRPGGTIFGAAHRIGSIFMEPLSLGYFACITAIYHLHFFSGRLKSALLPVIVCIMLCFLSDSRTSIFVITVVTIFRGALRRNVTELRYMSPVIVIAVVGVFYALQRSGGGDLVYRLSLTFGALANASLTNILFGGTFQTVIGDSGIIYIISNAGILGLFLFYFLASGFFLAENRASFVTQAVLLYLVVSSMFGLAIFSLKTAALLGYGIGSAVNDVRTRSMVGFMGNSQHQVAKFAKAYKRPNYGHG